MSNTYTPEEFAISFSLRGYGKKNKALEWIKEQGLTTADESDFVRCYHDLNDRKVVNHKVKGVAMRADGVNLSAPEHMKG